MFQLGVALVGFSSLEGLAIPALPMPPWPLGLHRRVTDAVVHGLLWPRLYNANRGQQPVPVGVTPRATNGPTGLLHVTQRERQIHPSSDTTGKRGNVMPNHNEAPNPIPSPSELMNRFDNEVPNNKNLSAIDEIAAEDYVELDLPPGQAPGRKVESVSLRPCCFRAFPDQRWVTVIDRVVDGKWKNSRLLMDNLSSSSSWAPYHRHHQTTTPRSGTVCERPK